MPKDLNPTIRLGAVIKSRTGKVQGTVIKIDSKRFIIERVNSLKLQSITFSMVNKTLARLKRGETLGYQKNPGQGGISYTVLVERGVIAALGHRVKETPKGYKLA
jgi:hypothetical protein